MRRAGLPILQSSCRLVYPGQCPVGILQSDYKCCDDKFLHLLHFQIRFSHREGSVWIPRDERGRPQWLITLHFTLYFTILHSSHLYQTVLCPHHENGGSDFTVCNETAGCVYFCIFYFIFCAFVYFEHTEDESGVYFCIFYFIFCAFVYFEHTEDEVGAVKRFHGAQQHSRSGAAGQMAARIEKKETNNNEIFFFAQI